MTFYNELDLRHAERDLEQIRQSCESERGAALKTCRIRMRSAQFRVEHIARRLEVQPQEARRLNNPWLSRPELDAETLRKLLDTL